MQEKKQPGNQKNDRQFWARHVRNQQKSQQSQARYCRENKLNLSTFRYWVRKIKPRSDDKPSGADEGNHSSHDLVEVTRMLSAYDRGQVSSPSFLEIEIGQTWKIRIPPFWAMDDLKKILAVLKELVC